MWNEQGQMVATKPANLVAALFFNEMSARDAIADLKLAGLSKKYLPPTPGPSPSQRAVNTRIKCPLEKEKYWKFFYRAALFAFSIDGSNFV